MSLPTSITLSPGPRSTAVRAAPVISRSIQTDVRRARHHADAERGSRVTNDAESGQFGIRDINHRHRRIFISGRARKPENGAARHHADHADIACQCETFAVFTRFDKDRGARRGARDCRGNRLGRADDDEIRLPSRSMRGESTRASGNRPSARRTPTRSGRAATTRKKAAAGEDAAHATARGGAVAENRGPSA